MSVSIARWWPMLACGGVAMFGSPCVRAAEWLVEPDARMAADYTDNPRLLPTGGESTTGGFAELSADIRRRSERSDFSLQPRWRSSRYEDDDTLNSDDQYLTASMRHAMERSQWDLMLGFTRDSTLTSELGSTGIVQANRRHEGITVSGGPSFTMTERVTVGAQAYWLGNHYVDAAFTGLVDYAYGALSLYSAFSWTPRSTFTFTAQAGELEVDGQSDSTRDTTLRLAWKYQPHPLWTAELSAGPAFVRTEAADDTGAVFAFDISRKFERWNLTARAARDLSPTGRGVLTRRDQIVFGASRLLTDRLSGGMSLKWISNQDLLPTAGVAFQEVTYSRLDLRASWRIAEHWSIALALGAATQDYDNSPGRAENYRASLSMVWNGQAQTL